MDQRYGDTKLLACAKRWSGVLQTLNWSGVFENYTHSFNYSLIGEKTK